MNKMMLGVLALALAVTLPALTQDTTQSSTPANPGTNQAATGSGASTDSQMGQTLTGTISADGKTFDSNGTTYTVSNPNSVKAYANQPITVGYEMDNNNTIRITKVMLSKPQQ